MRKAGKAFFGEEGVRLIVSKADEINAMLPGSGEDICEVMFFVVDHNDFLWGIYQLHFENDVEEGVAFRAIATKGNSVVEVGRAGGLYRQGTVGLLTGQCEGKVQISQGFIGQVQQDGVSCRYCQDGTFQLPQE